MPDSVIGLGDAERAAYELLVDRPAATLEELATMWTRAEPLAGVLAALEERAVICSTAGPPPRYGPVAPDVAFASALTDFEERLDRARRHIGILDAAFQAKPAEHNAATVVEVVTGNRAIRQRLRQLQRGARTQVGCLAKPPYFDNDGTTDAALELLGRAVACRTVYARSAIEHPGALATVERLSRAGQESRVLPDLPLTVYLVDDRHAVLPLRRGPADFEPGTAGAAGTAGAEAAVVVHPSALLDALVKLFEGMWQRALPLHPPVEEQRTGVDQQRLITLLLSGLTDEAIARQLGLSHRTVQRRVATFMADVGAHTRFQAGVKAALQQHRR